MQMEMANKTPEVNSVTNQEVHQNHLLKNLKKMQEDLKKEMNGKSGKDGEKGKKKGEKNLMREKVDD